MIEVEIPGKGRRMVHYLYYRVVNRTGKPRRFVPQFTLVDDKGRLRGHRPPPGRQEDPGPRRPPHRPAAPFQSWG